MVTVTSCLERQRKDGTSFTFLEISGGVELVKSQITQRYYATPRKCTIPFTGSVTSEVTVISLGLRPRRPHEALNNLTPEEWKSKLEITEIHKLNTVC